ncbi:unnamed protein product [Medioppia subpectinata]|uniref:Protein SYS1 homolog n=1 Tax=Medioppia subpectinata TaxID=1979941 RepID=A0A7R9KJP1_9ACAR|nr:unnamed protein product [Medioppia subpectinata]CAG2103417.1 unnamed protein product [Medioppia subpectinata]
MSGHFRYTQWDPQLIISQIITIQSLFYTSLGVLIYISDCITGHSPQLNHLFNYQELNFKSSHGRLIILSYFLNALFGALVLWHLVQRAKPCLDFSVTTHLIHLVICWVFSGHFPSSMWWWIVNILSVTITCVCGEFLCLKTELKSIPLTLSQRTEV